MRKQFTIASKNSFQELEDIEEENDMSNKITKEIMSTINAIKDRKEKQGNTEVIDSYY